MDFFYIGVAVLMFGMTYGLLTLCERLSRSGSGEHS